MAWLETGELNFNIRPETELWSICPKCKGYFDKEVWRASQPVCPRCGAPVRLDAYARIDSVADEGSFVETNANYSISDPLSFESAGVKYIDKAAETCKKTGLNEAVVTGTCAIEGQNVAIGVMDFRFFGGSLSSGAGEKIVRLAELALEEHLPLILFTASGGARMHEGIISLMQMARTTAALERLRSAHIPYISVLTDPTTGGVSASFALTADVVLSEPRALIGFAGRRVIESTIKQQLPDDFQTAEYMLSHGFIDAIVERKNLKSTLAKILSYNHPYIPKVDAKVAQYEPQKSRSAWETVELARDKNRPSIRDYVAACDDFFELHGDRLFGDDSAMLGGFCTIRGVKCICIGNAKGHTMEENIAQNFGMSNPEGYRKAMRLMHIAEVFDIPVLTLVDTPGAYPGADAEARGQAEAIGRNLCEMSKLSVPIVSVITGEGGSGGAIGIAAGDSLLMLENAVYSVISPEGCASILWRDGTKMREAASALKITAQSLVSLGIADGIIPEGEGGAQSSKKETINNLFSAALRELLRLLALPKDELISTRYLRLRKMGMKNEN